LNVSISKLIILAEGQYAVSCELGRTLRFIYESQKSERHPWRGEINSALDSFFRDFNSIEDPKEKEVLLSFLPGSDFKGPTLSMPAQTSSGDYLTILGFVQADWLSRSVNQDKERERVHYDYKRKELKALTLTYSKANKGNCNFQPYSQSEFRIVDENPIIHAQQEEKHPFKLQPEALAKLFVESKLLLSVDEEDISQA